MFTINYVSATENRVVKEEHTIADAKRFCNEWAEGRRECDEDSEKWSRLEIEEALPDGNLETVFVTPFYEG